MAARKADNNNIKRTKPRIIPGPPEAVIPVIEEELVVGRNVVETGKVRVSKRVSEHEEVIDEPLIQEKVRVERVPVNQFIDAAPQIRHEGDLMIIPVVEERLVMQKRLVLVEEVRIRKEIVEAHQPQTVVLRKEAVDVKRIAGEERAGGTKRNNTYKQER